MEFVSVTLNKVLKEIDPDILTVGYQYINNMEIIKIIYRRKMNAVVYVTGLNDAYVSLGLIDYVSMNKDKLRQNRVFNYCPNCKDLK